ncbi:hypothetical protein FEM33_01635 [Dyadobacter flavalbus]|uniref:Uncharacterized protein n=1 Tax=Dyadobacter flavalbus TaxID=2579942 RepID=A0A5M8R5M9_9BACT|nr:hypothetical protein [Dyadobacter flavalbus]KAA6441462.1 hypothetical protein FEM33_01635 [Dyadobacter flavalbus]
MKEKIIARLRALYPGVNLSKARLDEFANPDKLKITDETTETEIDEKLNYLNAILPFAEVAKQDDRLRTLEAKEKKPADPKPQDPPKPEDTPNDLQKAIAEAVQAAVAPLVQKISGLENGKTAESRKSQLEAKLKDAPEQYKQTILKNFSRINFESDEAFNEYLTETETDLTAFTQDLSNQSLANNGKPFKVTTPGNNKEASKEEVAELSKNLKI